MTVVSIPPPRKTVKQEVISWGKAIGVALVIWIGLRSYLVEAFRIPSSSMENTLLVGDFLFVNKAAFGGELEIPLTGIHFGRLPAYATPRAGDVVVFRSVEDSTPNLNIVKRLIGGPGDTLEMRAGVLWLNGEPLDEPYVRPGSVPDDAAGEFSWQREHLVAGVDPATYRPTRETWGPIVVPADHYFMLGDNRDDSYDSRYWGPLATWRVEARVAFLYFSYNRDSYRPFPALREVRWNRLGRGIDGIEDGTVGATADEAELSGAAQ